MTPKEKAKELVEKFQWKGDVARMSLDNSKQSALICVDEKIKFAYSIEWEKKEEAISKLKILKEVKQEINKL
tara:strand:+ start:42 stop:257 length:216 start_codon:yes stop_codon:yes gene_type:complete